MFNGSMYPYPSAAAPDHKSRPSPVADSGGNVVQQAMRRFDAHSVAQRRVPDSVMDAGQTKLYTQLGAAELQIQQATAGFASFAGTAAAASRGTGALTTPLTGFSYVTPPPVPARRTATSAYAMPMPSPMTSEGLARGYTFPSAPAHPPFVGRDKGAGSGETATATTAAAGAATGFASATSTSPAGSTPPVGTTGTVLTAQQQQAMWEKLTMLQVMKDKIMALGQVGANTTERLQRWTNDDGLHHTGTQFGVPWASWFGDEYRWFLVRHHDALWANGRSRLWWTSGGDPIGQQDVNRMVAASPAPAAPAAADLGADPTLSTAQQMKRMLQSQAQPPVASKAAAATATTLSGPVATAVPSFQPVPFRWSCLRVGKDSRLYAGGTRQSQLVPPIWEPIVVCFEYVAAAASSKSSASGAAPVTRSSVGTPGVRLPTPSKSSVTNLVGAWQQTRNDGSLSVDAQWTTVNGCASILPDLVCSARVVDIQPAINDDRHLYVLLNVSPTATTTTRGNAGASSAVESSGANSSATTTSATTSSGQTAKAATPSVNESTLVQQRIPTCYLARLLPTGQVDTSFSSALFSEVLVDTPTTGVSLLYEPTNQVIVTLLRQPRGACVAIVDAVGDRKYNRVLHILDLPLHTTGMFDMAFSTTDPTLLVVGGTQMTNWATGASQSYLSACRVVAHAGAAPDPSSGSSGGSSDTKDSEDDRVVQLDAVLEFGTTGNGELVLPVATDPTADASGDTAGRPTYSTVVKCVVTRPGGGWWVIAQQIGQRYTDYGDVQVWLLDEQGHAELDAVYQPELEASPAGGGTTEVCILSVERAVVSADDSLVSMVGHCRRHPFMLDANQNMLLQYTVADRSFEFHVLPGHPDFASEGQAVAILEQAKGGIVTALNMQTTRLDWSIQGALAFQWARPPAPRVPASAAPAPAPASTGPATDRARPSPSLTSVAALASASEPSTH